MAKTVDWPDLFAMKRVPEVELMQDLHQVKVYSEADFFCSDKAFLASLEKFLNSVNKTPSDGTRIVDLGCGPGNITNLLSERWPHSSILGIDGSEPMLDIARATQNPYCYKSKFLRYECIDISLLANNSSNITPKADIVVSNSVLHHYSKSI